MSPKIVDKKKRRKEIALTAFQLFIDHGFEHTSVKEIAEHMGVSKASIYDYYKTKDDLIAAALKAWIDSMDADMEMELGLDQNPEERLRDYLGTFIEVFIEDNSMVQLMIRVFQLMLTTKKGHVIREQLIYKMLEGPRNRIIKILLDGVAQGHFKPELSEDVEVIAMNLLAYGDGIVLYYWFSNQAFDLKKHINFYFDRLIEDITI